MNVAIPGSTSNANSTAPSADGVSCRVACMVGIRDAQLAKHNPCRKNTSPTAIRFRCNARVTLSIGAAASIANPSLFISAIVFMFAIFCNKCIVIAQYCKIQH